MVNWFFPDISVQRKSLLRAWHVPSLPNNTAAQPKNLYISTWLVGFVVKFVHLIYPYICNKYIQQWSIPMYTTNTYNSTTQKPVFDMLRIAENITLHIKLSFSLGISSVNLTKSEEMKKFLMENFIFCAVSVIADASLSKWWLE